MNHLWLNQPIDRKLQWKKRIWYSNHVDYGLEPECSTLDKLLRQSNNTFKHDQTTTVAQVELGQNTVVVKRYNSRSLAHKFKRALRRSRARRCWNMSYRFQSAGLNVPQPILMCEKRFGPIRRDAFFVNQFLHGEELIKLLPKLGEAQRQAVLDSIKHAFETMRKHRLTHGDMKASNLLWVDKQLVFIDLDAAKQHYSRFSWEFAHKKDKRRFLKNWKDNPQLLKLFAKL